jgi:hypothetical protein
VLRKHSYITDGILTGANYTFDQDFRPWRLMDLIVQWQRAPGRRKKFVNQVQSFDNGYVVNDLEKVVVCDKIETYTGFFSSGSRLVTGLNTQYLTESGYKRFRNLALGEPLMVMDNFKSYYGDKITLAGNGNSRLRAYLRSHRIEFEIDRRTNGTLLDNVYYYVVDWDTEKPVEYDNRWTLGLNNFRKFMRDKFSLPVYSTDNLLRIEKRARLEFSVGIETAGAPNIVLQHGFIAKTTDSEISDDRKYIQPIDPRLEETYHHGN